LLMNWLVASCALVPGDMPEDTRPSAQPARQQVTSATTGEAESSQQAGSNNDIPVEASAQFQEALTLMRHNKLTAARASLLELTERYPDLSGPLVNLALLSIQDKDTGMAYRYLNQAIKINPENGGAFRIKAIVASRQGRFDEAISLYQQALAINASDEQAHLNLGIIYDLYKGRLDLALNHYQAYRGLIPEPDEKVNFWIVDIERRLAP
jgi:tetratricopeptide (TPR) repeat protein